MTIGWQVEKDWPLVDDRGERVIGNDRFEALISIKLRLMDAGVEQRSELERTNSKLAAAVQQPLIKQNSVKTYKLGAAVDPYALAQQQLWEQDQRFYQSVVQPQQHHQSQSIRCPRSSQGCADH